MNYCLCNGQGVYSNLLFDEVITRIACIHESQSYWHFVNAAAPWLTFELGEFIYDSDHIYQSLSIATSPVNI